METASTRISQELQKVWGEILETDIRDVLGRAAVAKRQLRADPDRPGSP